MAVETVVIEPPKIMSTLSSVTKRRALLTPLPGSEASSRMIRLTFSPAMVCGQSLNWLPTGMPSPEAGPVSESVTPMLTSACAGIEAQQREQRRAEGLEGLHCRSPLRVIVEADQFVTLVAGFAHAGFRACRVGVQRALRTRSTSAMAESPAAQPLNTPVPPPRSTSSSISSITERMPVGPCGCPQISDEP